jgi:hypothetical protein
MPFHIAILGWGSLLWDIRPEFDELHGNWEFDGPMMKIEFSRVSKSRRGALTLVIDQLHGAPCQVAYTRSKRRNPEDTICDLRSREETTHTNIGFWFANGSQEQSRDTATLAAVSAWAAAKHFDVVVWTDLPSNFKTICGGSFTIQHAVAHLNALEPPAKTAAVEYVQRAPGFVNTPLRVAVQSLLANQREQASN